MNKKQSGSAHLIIIVILSLALIGTLGFVFYQNFIQKKETVSKTVDSSETTTKANSSTQKTSDTTDPYKGWQTYHIPGQSVTLRYPAQWTIFVPDGGSGSSFLAGVGIVPAGESQVVVTVSVFSSQLSPKEFVETNGSMSGMSSSIQDSNNNSINGNTAYYYKYGDSSYTNRSYVIGHSGKNVTVTMSEKVSAQTGLAAVDNTAYIGQFDLIAKSINFN